MPSASEFIDPDGQNPVREREQGAALIRAISDLSKHEKDALAMEFVSIAINPAEKLLRRVQAARMLAHQARRLEIVGSTPIAIAVLSALRTEYLPERLLRDDQQSVALLGLDALDQWLFQYLVTAVCAIDRILGRSLCEELIPTAKGTEMEAWLKWLFRQAQEEDSG